MIRGISFNPTEYLNKEDGGCLIKSVHAILDFSGFSNCYQQIIKNLKPGLYGYDFIEIAERLAKANLLMKFGLYDIDYISVLKVGEKLDYKALSRLKSQATNFRKCDIESLESVIKFASEYNKLLQIERTKYGVLKRWLLRGYPVCIHTKLGTLYKTDCDVIHAQVVYAFDDSVGQIYIWDPDAGYLVYKTKIYIHAWWEAGGYYLVIKNKKGGKTLKKLPPVDNCQGNLRTRGRSSHAFSCFVF